ncbi:hypothetical protein AA12717_2011 [Gluconacetobacter sacchari DSM 12717]|uniref:Uncharacterized protein n=1 Tax=Gluconacetobacter sacchari DSM 12717 TaxID=1307940 RepID=A0ABQ0P789_9PROT|nr:hypothetical protein AA12717_2011 [Gluconacetobacter sacchari DSM 12717]
MTRSSLENRNIWITEAPRDDTARRPGGGTGTILPDHPAHDQKERPSGAGEEIRTPDPIITNDVLYQLSYTGNEASV